MTCPVKGCTAHPRAGHLMCLGHWRMVPRPMQMAVNRTWRNVRNDSEAYRDARDKAIAAVDAQQRQDMLL